MPAATPPPVRVHPNVPPYTGGKTEGILKVGAAEEPLASGEDGHGRWLIEHVPGGPGVEPDESMDPC